MRRALQVHWRHGRISSGDLWDAWAVAVSPGAAIPGSLMTSRTVVCAMLLTLAATPGVARSVASSTAHDDDCPSEMSLMASAEDAPTVDLVDVEVIVPCAVAESGAFGADCQDTPFYVVNNHGTLLCRMDITAFAIGAPVSVVDDAPPAGVSPDMSRVPGAILSELPPPQAPPLMRLLLAAAPTAGLQAADAHHWTWPQPS